MGKQGSVIFTFFFIVLSVVVLFVIKMQIEDGYSAFGDGTRYYRTIEPFKYWGVIAVQFFIFLLFTFYAFIAYKSRGEFNSFWISSVEHLDKVAEITKKATLWQKTFGKFDMPDNFPCLKMSFGGNMGKFWWIGILLKFLVARVPVVFSGIAEIKIEDNKIIFTKTEYYSSIGKAENITQVEGEITKESIESIERYNPKITSNRAFDINWIRIKTKDKNIMNGDILLSMYYGSLHKEQTDKLYERLLEFKNS